METRLNSLIYPIYGFIRSEFDNVDQMLVNDKRCGQKVKVGKSEWRIHITRCCLETTDNYLLVYLMCCSGIDSWSSIKVSCNFQLTCWDKKANNVVYNSTELREYTSKNAVFGCSKFLKWEEMLNGGYVKDGKIVVECAFRIDSEDGIPRRSIDFTEERPNTKDIEMICGVEDVLKSKRIEETIDVSKIDEDGIFTETYFINGLPFKIDLCKVKSWQNIDKLAGFFFLNSYDKSEWWRCETEADKYLLNQITKDPIKIGFTTHSFEKGRPVKRVGYFNWDELMDPKNGYVKDGKIIIQAFVQIVTLSGFDKKTGQGYSQPMRKMTDAVLKIGEEEFHFSEKILSQQSSYFSQLFSRDEENEYEKIDFAEDEFFKFLNMVYNQDTIVKGNKYFTSYINHSQDTIVDEDEIESVLELAEKWGSPEVIERCDAVLKRMELTDTMDMLELVDKYNLPELRRRFILNLKDDTNFEAVVNDPRYKTLSDKLKVAILEWRLVPEEQQTEEKEDSDYQFNTDFKKESEFTDVEIMVEGYKYHASKQILANASVFFMKRFYGPYSSDESQIKIFRVSPLQFETLLTHIYHPTRPVTCASLDSLLSLSKQFSVHRLMDKCEEYLILNNTLPLIQKLEYAGKYELPLLLSACLNHTDEKSLQDQIGVLPAYVTEAFAKRNIVQKRIEEKKEKIELRQNKKGFFSSIFSLFD